MAHELKNVHEVLVRPDHDAITIVYNSGLIEVVKCEHLLVQYHRHTTDQGREPRQWEEINITGHTEATPIPKDQNNG